MASNQYVSLNETATVTEVAYNVHCKTVKMVANDSATYDLKVGFGSPLSSNYVVVKAGETLSNLEEVSCEVLYVATVSGTVPFRFLGTTYALKL
jgi:hypothetical protein